MKDLLYAKSVFHFVRYIFRKAVNLHISHSLQKLPSPYIFIKEIVSATTARSSFICLLVVMLCVSTITLGQVNKLASVQMRTLDGTPFHFPKKLPYPVVIIFLSAECPLSQNYTSTLNTLSKKFAKDSIAFYGIFPGKYVEESEISAFVKKYNITFPVLADKRNALAKLLQATVTPEAILINDTQKVLYQGKIDNWVVELGKKRREPSEHYLQDAIAAIINHQEIIIKHTKPIGCSIER